MKALFVVGQVAVDARLFEGYESVKGLQIGRFTVVIVAYFADERVLGFECQSALVIHRRLSFVKDKVDLISASEGTAKLGICLNNIIISE